jgi:hypothetical protein
MSSELKYNFYELNLLSIGLRADVRRRAHRTADAKLDTLWNWRRSSCDPVSHVDFTFSYVANPKRLSGEQPGSVFSLRFKDLLE